MPFKSVDTRINPNKSYQQQQATNLMEILSSIEQSGTSLHKLTLKKEMPVMLMHNLQVTCVYNGTRQHFTLIHANMLQAIVLTSSFKGQTMFTPCIPIIFSELPLKFNQLQFPLNLALQ